MKMFEWKLEAWFRLLCFLYLRWSDATISEILLNSSNPCMEASMEYKG